MLLIAQGLKCSIAHQVYLPSGLEKATEVKSRLLFGVMFTETFWVTLLIGLFLSEVCNCASFAFPQNAFFQRPQLLQSQSSVSSVHKQQNDPGQVNSVRVTCHPDSLEIRIKADMFGVGASVKGDHLHLGVDRHELCSPSAFVGTEYRIVVGLMDCGTKHWVTSVLRVSNVYNV